MAWHEGTWLFYVMISSSSEIYLENLKYLYTV